MEINTLRFGSPENTAEHCGRKEIYKVHPNTKIFLAGLCQPVLRTLTLYFRPKYTISIPYFRPIYTQFQSLRGTVISATLYRIYSDTVRDTVTPQTMCLFFFLWHVSSGTLLVKSYPRPNMRNTYPISKWTGNFCTLFRIINTRKWYALGRHILMWLIYSAPPPPPPLPQTQASEKGSRIRPPAIDSLFAATSPWSHVRQFDSVIQLLDIALSVEYIFKRTHTFVELI